jgi:GntR family transcriptional repressor for pyruvate dehydrogenase complex
MPAPIRPASTGNLSDLVADYLIDYTRRRRLKSGEEVPSEGTLSHELNVSRGVVREAFRSLRTAGILDIANGRSPRVGRLSTQALTQFLNHALHTEQASTAHALDVRNALEVRAAELAARNRSEDDVAALQREATIMRDSNNRRRRFIDADIRFHEILGRATGNPLFALLGSALREALDASIRAGFDSRRTAAEHDRVAATHTEIANAIAARRPALARRLMQRHFTEAATFILGASTRTPARGSRRKPKKSS